MANEKKERMGESKAKDEHKSVECNCNSLAIHLVSFSFYPSAENISPCSLRTDTNATYK